jgi:hypothetical protein
LEELTVDPRVWDGRQENFNARRQTASTTPLANCFLLPTMSGQVPRSSGNKLIEEKKIEGIFQKSRVI